MTQSASDVVALFADIAGTDGRIDQARALQRAVKGFNALDVTQKRDLAIRIAERVAPDIVPKIQAETDADFTIAQVQAVLDMARRLDAGEVAELRAVVAEGEGIAGLPAAAAVVAQALDEPPAATPPAPDDLAHLPPPVPDDVVDTDASPDEVVDGNLLLQQQEEQLQARIAAAEAERLRRLEEAQAERERAVAEAVAERAQARADAEAVIAAARQEADDMFRRVEQMTTDAAEDRPREREVEAAAIAAGRGSEASRAVLRRVFREPDGWRRRRCIDGLLRAEEIPEEALRDVIATLSSPMARTWVTATAIEAEMLSLDDLDGVVDTRSAARLRRRYA